MPSSSTTRRPGHGALHTNWCYQVDGETGLPRLSVSATDGTVTAKLEKGIHLDPL